MAYEKGPVILGHTGFTRQVTLVKNIFKIFKKDIEVRNMSYVKGMRLTKPVGTRLKTHMEDY